MHEDICTVALDKLVSLIVLPFHRRWSVDGSVESEDHNTRILNCSVLDRAPCSVGILVDRGHLGQSSIVAPGSSFSVAIIFLGGKDDREALAFGKRMTNDSTISLTVIRLVASADEVDGSKWDNVLDAEELKGFRYNDVREGFVIYLEEVVEDGPQTALLLRSIVDDYDLIIVGRRFNVNSPQTSGLSEWSEFPELGTIGDLLASPDITCRASVLVVQQQKMVTQ
ncbi:cation/H(+) antiporter 4-like [Prunus yedoensis var. nudiflora]|nr:cation/H(+) antiporter 4-like [Prunus yedoensis var. nudiflora]